MNSVFSGEMQLLDFAFEHIGSIIPETDSVGRLREFMPQHRYRNAATKDLHSWGAGPFCRFRIARSRKQGGLYVVTLDNDPVYVGECVDLSRRFGPNGYGGISPRNCFVGGQPTNCRINTAILSAVKEQQTIDLWFKRLDLSRAARRALEIEIMRLIQPRWNLQC